MGVDGFVKAKPESGFAVFKAHQDPMGARWASTSSSRASSSRGSWCAWASSSPGLPEADRVTPIVKAVKALGTSFAGLLVEMPDTNDGKSLATPHAPASRRTSRRRCARRT
jgi:23S rRNA (cytidine2498-2'-O)-methyltransferase